MPNNIVIVAHKFLQQPDDDLVVYLNSIKKPKVMHIMHSFPDAKDRKSSYFAYQDGLLKTKEETFDYIGYPEVVLYVKELYYTLKWVLIQKTKFDLYIGMDGLTTCFGLLLRFLGKVKKVAYWAMDFVPENRFKGSMSGIKNFMYRLINTTACKNSDEMWDISPRMLEARREFWGLKETTYRYHKVVPFGVWHDRITRITYEDSGKSTIVFMGHLLEKQGVQLIIKSLPIIAKIVPDITLKIIGDGSYKDTLIRLAKDLSVMDRCEFMGKIPDHRDLETIIANSAVAVAPYIKELDTWTYYADPGKIKVYLACGVPTILTDIPWNAQEIVLAKCGLITKETPEDIANNIILLLNPAMNSKYRINATKYSQSYNYTNIFSFLNTQL